MATKMKRITQQEFDTLCAEHKSAPCGLVSNNTRCGQYVKVMYGGLRQTDVYFVGKALDENDADVIELVA